MKILKHGIKGQYYRFTCPNCHCEFVADISEISSWGELTGRLKLSPNDAAKIQDNFCKYIVNRLNNPT